MQGNPYQTYQNTQIQTASQGKLIIMLFDGAIKFIRMAIQSLEEKEYSEVNYYTGRAQAIVNELKVTLNSDAGEIAQHLYGLYDYIYRRLIEANVKKNQEIMEEVIDLLSDLRETWIEVIKASKTSNAPIDLSRGVEG